MIWLFLLLLLVPPALWYLGSRAEITRWLWGHYPPRVARFMDCAACTGFWYGMIVFTGVQLYTASLNTLVFMPLSGLCTLITTPLVAYLHDQALFHLGEIEEQDASAAE